MKLFTFTAESPAVALKKAHSACGKDALVVSTKQIRKKSLNQDAIYELVVAVEDNIPRKKETKKEPIKATFDDEILTNISQTAQQLSRLEKLTEPLETLDTHDTKGSFQEVQKEVKKDEFKELRDEIGTLSDKIRILQNMLWEKNDGAKSLAIPPEFAEIYRVAQSSGIQEEHITEIMNETLKHMPSYMKDSPETIKRYFHVLLKKMIPTRIEKPIQKGEKKIMMFVGSTGVGKTTTLAKLAAKYSFLEYKNRVGIITLDTYRIGALEQLFQYAKMLKLPIEDATDSVDFEKALDSLNHCDLILIDTAGNSPKDKGKITNIAKFLKNTKYDIDVNLVLSASAKYEDLKEAYDSFSFLNIDTLVVTKLDESKNFGNIFSLIYESKKPTSYFSIGQEVPDDIEVATGDFLVDCLYEGFDKKVYS